MESGYSTYPCTESAPQREEEEERPAEEQPLLTPPLTPRVMSDDVSTPPLPPRPARVVADDGSADQESHETSTPVQETSDGDSNGPMYATAVLLSSSHPVSSPGTTEKLVYDDVKGFQNQQVLGNTCMVCMLHLQSHSIGCTL